MSLLTGLFLSLEDLNTAYRNDFLTIKFRLVEGLQPANFSYIDMIFNSVNDFFLYKLVKNG